MVHWLALVLAVALVWRAVGYVQERACVVLSPRTRFYALVALATVKFGLFLAFAHQSGVDVQLFVKLLLAGGACALITHSCTTPLDVVRTKMQLEPDAYPTPLAALRKILKQDGPAMLLQGLGPTAAGYFLHGALKYAWYEQFRGSIMRLARQWAMSSGGGGGGAGAMAGATATIEPSVSSAYYVLAATGAEIIASAALCPLEAVRIRLVADPTFARGLLGGFSKLANEGVFGMYKGLIPLICKQVPYTVAQFWSYEYLLTRLRLLYMLWALPSPSSSSSRGDEQLDRDLAAGVELTLSLAAGILSGVCAAVASQPGDTLLSRVNQHLADDDAVAARASATEDGVVNDGDDSGDDDAGDIHRSNDVDGDDIDGADCEIHAGTSDHSGAVDVSEMTDMAVRAETARTRSPISADGRHRSGVTFSLSNIAPAAAAAAAAGGDDGESNGRHPKKGTAPGDGQIVGGNDGARGKASVDAGAGDNAARARDVAPLVEVGGAAPARHSIWNHALGQAPGPAPAQAPSKQQRQPPPPPPPPEQEQQEQQQKRRRNVISKYALDDGHAVHARTHAHRRHASPRGSVFSLSGATGFAAMVQQMLAHMVQVARDIGTRGMLLGLGPRCVQVAAMVTAQFLIYGSIKSLCGVPPTLGRGAAAPADVTATATSGADSASATH